MPITATRPPAPRTSSAPAKVARTVAVATRPDEPTALVRVLGVLVRRGCRVTRVDFVAADRHRPARLVIGYDAPAAHADRAVTWLRALVDVVSVEPQEP